MDKIERDKIAEKVTQKLLPQYTIEASRFIIMKKSIARLSPDALSQIYCSLWHPSKLGKGKRGL